MVYWGEIVMGFGSHDVPDLHFGDALFFPLGVVIMKHHGRKRTSNVPVRNDPDQLGVFIDHREMPDAVLEHLPLGLKNARLRIDGHHPSGHRPADKHNPSPVCFAEKSLGLLSVQQYFQMIPDQFR